MTPISLVPEKKSYPEPCMPCCSESSCPTVYLNAGKELLDLPEEGTITFKYDRKSLTVREDSVELCLKLVSIEDAKEEAVEDDEENDMDSGSAIDKLKSELDDED